MKAKHQRLVLLGLAVVAVLGAVLLGMSALRDKAAYFYAPADVARKGVPLDQAVRIGGMVVPGSIKRDPDGVSIDFIVGDLVVLEIKSVDRVTPVHEAQMLTYLRVTGRALGFVLNFNAAVMRHGIHRVVLQRGSRSLDDDAFDRPP